MNAAAGDGCDATCHIEVTAFRFSSLALRDPHVYYDGGFLGCQDVTDAAGLGLNDFVQGELDGDGDGDGLLDLSPLLLFRPLDQGVPGGAAIDLAYGDCTAPAAGTVCTLGAPPPVPTTYANSGAGTCLAPLAGTLSTAGYSPPVSSPGAPCFVTATADATLVVFGTVIPTHGAQAAGTYVGAPATSLATGLLRAFLTEADADATPIGASVPLVGGDPLSSVLPGGTGACAVQDDRDMGPDGAGGTTTGWWIYFEFTAAPVGYTGP